jgi:hypothetical protein
MATDREITQDTLASNEAEHDEVEQGSQARDRRTSRRGMLGSALKVAAVGAAGLAGAGVLLESGSGTARAYSTFVEVASGSGNVAIQAAGSYGAIGLQASSDTSVGIYGGSWKNHGVCGGTDAASGGSIAGVCGFSNAYNGYGVIGECSHGPSAIGVMGKSASGGFGVYSYGNFGATGTKSAIVPHPDGSHRMLYCVESPECWFEDFGTATLVGGAATVQLDPDFAAVVDSTAFHVFLAAEGDSRGLFVSTKSPTGFTVREQQAGTSTLAFSYRVVARRKDVEAPRLERVTLKELPNGGAAPAQPPLAGRR